MEDQIITIDINNVRDEVKGFAILMEAKLRANDHKEHWSTCTKAYLIERLEEELVELKLAIGFGGGGMTVVTECVDVANFAMMLADQFSKE